MTRRLRTPESIKRKIDSMLQKGKVILDHGIGAYEFDHYDYEEPSINNGYLSKLNVYYKDFDKDKTVKIYMTVTENNLRKPRRTDWFTWLVDCYWEKEYPTLLYMREYRVYS